LPRQWIKGDQALRVYHTVGFAFSDGALHADADVQQILWSARQRLTELLYKERFPGLHDKWGDDVRTQQVLSTLYIEFDDPSAELGPETDESYELTVPGTGTGPLKAHLRAKTVYGVVHGLTSFSQLVFLVAANVDDTELAVALTIPHTPHLIVDRPRFTHRGLLLDTSRNYYPLEDLLRLLDVMGWNKLNVFHWHVVDSHSWPIKSERYPELSEKGAYDPKTMVYSRQGVAIIVRYARNVSSIEFM
jgi:hexosaminidase